MRSPNQADRETKVALGNRKNNKMQNHQLNRKIGALLQGLGAAIQTQPRRPAGPRPPRTFFAHRPRPKTRMLPGWMSRLNEMCKNHFAPMPMAFVKFTVSDNGHGVAQYRCPSCGRCHFMTLGAQGKPFCLFVK